MNNVLETYIYGASRNRLVNETTAGRTYYAWGGQAVIAEYFETVSTPEWVKSYIYAGSRLLSTITNNSGTEVEEFQHPDRLGTKLVTNPGTGSYYEHDTLPFGTVNPAESTGFSNQDLHLRPYLVTEAKSTTDYGDDDRIVIKTVQNSDNSVASKT